MNTHLRAPTLFDTLRSHELRMYLSCSFDPCVGSRAVHGAEDVTLPEETVELPGRTRRMSWRVIRDIERIYRPVLVASPP